MRTSFPFILIPVLFAIIAIPATATIMSTTTNGSDTIVTWTTNLSAGSGQDMTTWTVPPGVSQIYYLVIGGGGAGGSMPAGGGGGAGGWLTNYGGNATSVSGTLTINVGSGGVGVSGAGNNGANSSISGTGISVTSDGGGGGGRANSHIGKAGGSGGGGGGYYTTGYTKYQGGSGSQGNNGGNGYSYSSTDAGGGGGGGKGSTGSAGIYKHGANGGTGSISYITGLATIYAGGGGGGCYGTGDYGGTGGSGIGGSGGGPASGAHTAGTDQTGSGGGGSGPSSDGNGASGGSGIVIVRYTVGATPTAAFGNTTGFPLTKVVPLTARFTDASTGSPTSWLWDFGDGDSTNSTVQNPVHVYSTAGTYNVNLTVSNAFGSDYEYKASYVHVLTAAPVADFTGTPTALLLGNSTTFTDSSTNAPTSWLWDFGDGNHAITQNPVYLWNITGIYTVNLTASNVGGSDKKTRIDYVNVSHPFPAPTPTPTPTPGGIAGLYTRFDSNASKGEYPLAIQFYDETINASANITSYLWSFGDGSYSTDKNPLHTYSSIGVYTVSLIVNSSIGNSTYIKDRLISVTPLAVIGRYFTDDGASLLLIGVAAGMILSTTFRRREQ